MEINEKIISPLVGLTGAVSNNGKTPDTDAIVMNALLRAFDPSGGEDLAAAITEEKFIISPGCKTCARPCGNTSDYDFAKFRANTALQPLKTAALRAAADLAERIHREGKTELPEDAYRAIAYLAYDLAEESYTELVINLERE